MHKRKSRLLADGRRRLNRYQVNKMEAKDFTRARNESSFLKVQYLSLRSHLSKVEKNACC